jgi:hypothetical protein
MAEGAFGAIPASFCLGQLMMMGYLSNLWEFSSAFWLASSTVLIVVLLAQQSNGPTAVSAAHLAS